MNENIQESVERLKLTGKYPSNIALQPTMLRNAAERKSLARQAKLGVSCRVKDPVPSARPNQPFVPSVAMMNDEGL